MDRLSSHRATKDVVEKHGFKFSKSYVWNVRSVIDTGCDDSLETTNTIFWVPFIGAVI